MNIGIDIDDTLSNTYETALPVAIDYVKNVLKKDIIPDLTGASNHYYIREIFKLSEEEEEKFWDDCYMKILDEIVPKESSVKIVKTLKELGHKICIITARWDTSDSDAYVVSKKWLEKNEIFYDKLIVRAENKDEIAVKENIDIFIDDSVENCEGVSKKGIQTFLFSTEMNKFYQEKDFERVHSWDEFYDKIKEEI